MNTLIFLLPIFGLAVVIAAAWLVYRWLIPVKLSEQVVADSSIQVPSIAADSDNKRRLQSIADGEGSLYKRIYSAQIGDAKLSPADLLKLIQRDINAFSPQELARFEKVKSAGHDDMQIGDQYHIAIAGPWDGPVEVIETAETSFTLATRQDHLEAGIITFSTEPAENGVLFKITSYARSANKLIEFAYEGLGVAKAAQTSMWMFFCNQVVEESGGELVGKIEIDTKISEGKIEYESER